MNARVLFFLSHVLSVFVFSGSSEIYHQDPFVSVHCVQKYVDDLLFRLPAEDLGAFSFLHHKHQTRAATNRPICD